ncbi:purple acid phosphatase family protein [Dyadobacter aurulentus]|uniref:purple acid phosphatase family protein n=1 Tax=Dyadobacter sp. UC 10 TaxID=2605428 RepID=UPI0011F3E277|nr:metallophosphoesterase family protein [Dyadobacter sp. UC 10]KAA0991996.1 metallophosphoesterase family protein [Dyadobacter sp. UC 10]
MLSDRRSFLEKMSQIGALSLLPLTASQAAAETLAETAVDDKNHFVAGPYLQNLGTDEVTIMWITHKNCFSWVEYGAGTYTSMREFGYTNGLIEANNRINKVTIKNLKPGTDHKYKLVSTEITGYKGSRVEFGESISSPLYGFKTPAENEDEFKMVVFNDIHDRPQIIPQLLYRHGYTGNKRDYDFVVFNGDCFDWVTEETQMIDHLIKPCVDIFATEFPFILTQGNHECRGSFSRHIPSYYAYPENKYYYAFTRGPVRFVVLDSGEDKADDAVDYGGLIAFDRYRETQRTWLEKEVESPEFKKADFRIVLIHISPYHSGDWHGTLHCRKVFGPVLNKAKIDLQISGHTHRYMTHEPDADHNFPIVIGGGPLEGKRTLIKLHATRKQLDLKMVRDDGEVVGKMLIPRKGK